MIVDLVAIGKRIKYLRESLNFSQVEIADYLSLDKNVVTKIEKGEINLYPDIIDKLSILFCCNVDYLLFGDNLSEECNILNTTNSLLLSGVSPQSLAILNKIVLNQFAMDKMLEQNTAY